MEKNTMMIMMMFLMFAVQRVNRKRLNTKGGSIEENMNFSMTKWMRSCSQKNTHERERADRFHWSAREFAQKALD
jgi:hypothetical protein